MFSGLSQTINEITNADANSLPWSSSRNPNACNAEELPARRERGIGTSKNMQELQTLYQGSFGHHATRFASIMGAAFFNAALVARMDTGTSWS